VSSHDYEKGLSLHVQGPALMGEDLIFLRGILEGKCERERQGQKPKPQLMLFPPTQAGENICIFAAHVNGIKSKKG
jgi:hypothetical protein